MTIMLSTICSPNSPLKPPQLPLKLSSHPPLFTRTRTHNFPFRSPLIRSQSLKLERTHIFSGISSKKLGFSFGISLGFSVKAENGEGESKNTSVDQAEEEARGRSTMPERFRHLTKEAPDLPVRWPWLIVLVFLVYAWRTVLWELSNWRKTVTCIIHFLGYLLKLVLSLIFHFVGNPITSLIRGIETALYTIRAFYSGIVAYSPIQELMMIIMLASATLAIAEATVPDSARSQPYLLTIAGLIGFAAVRSYISELFFWMLLLGLFGCSRFVKKRDYVSSALPAASVLAAVGEPWVRVVVIVSYLALAITHHSKQPSEENKDEAITAGRRVPVPLLCAALAIGIRVAAKWVGYRHLTWMIV